MYENKKRRFFKLSKILIISLRLRYRGSDPVLSKTQIRTPSLNQAQGFESGWRRIGSSRPDTGPDLDLSVKKKTDPELDPCEKIGSLVKENWGEKVPACIILEGFCSWYSDWIRILNLKSCTFYVQTMIFLLISRLFYLAPFLLYAQKTK